MATRPTPQGPPPDAQEKIRNQILRQEPPSSLDVPQPPDALTPEEAATAREQWKISRCTWCQGLHMRACPRVKRLTFANDGKTVTEVEFWQAGQWPEDNVVWPEEMRWDEDEGSPFDSAPSSSAD